MSERTTRKELVDILNKWMAGTLTANEVHKWADDRYPDVEFDDYEGEEDSSVANEVMGHLDMLNMNLMTAEDIPIYLRFLQTPIGMFDQGYRQFEKETSGIDMLARSRQLKGDPLYERFCK